MKQSSVVVRTDHWPQGRVTTEAVMLDREEAVAREDIYEFIAAQA